MSQTLPFFHLYSNPAAAIAFSDGLKVPEEELLKAARHFDEFYQEIFEEFMNYGEILDLVVADNIGEHMLGNVYVKFASEDQAQACFDQMNQKLYNQNPINVEYCPVTDFREAKCRKQQEGHCDRGGFCNFIHPKHVAGKMREELGKFMYQEYPAYLEAKKE